MAFETYQEAFDTTMEKLAEQGCLATVIKPSGNRVCAYTTPDGYRCGVGIHFPPYALEQAEGKRVMVLFDIHSELIGETLHVDESFSLRELRSFWKSVQSVHDNTSRDPVSLDYALKLLAELGVDTAKYELIKDFK